MGYIKSFNQLPQDTDKEGRNVVKSFDQLPQAVDQIGQEVNLIKRLLLDRQVLPPPEPPEKLLNVNGASEFLSLTVPTIYSKVSRGELPVMKRGKRLYFSSNELMAYLKEGRKMTNSEIMASADRWIAEAEKKKGGK